MSISPQLKTVLHQTWRKALSFAKRTLHEGQSTEQVKQPILSADDILQLADELSLLSASMPANLKQSEALRQGEQPSRFMGAGMEYEESRPYEMGDEIRRINWRLMARTGQAYTKLYQEERQENWFLLIDHRASMRFGTRTRLKATQAARIAGFYAWFAQQAGIPVAVGRLAESFEQSPIFEGRSLYSQIMQAVSKPCPPYQQQDSTAPEASLNDVLLSLSHQLQAGSRLIIVSDFHDVNERTTELLTAMQSFLAIKAVQVLDLSDMALPDIQGLQLQSMLSNQLIAISSKNQQASYQQWAKSYQTNIRQHLQNAGVGFYQLTADAQLMQINAVLSEARSTAHLEGATEQQVIHG